MLIMKELLYSVLKIYNNIVNSNYNYEICKDLYVKYFNIIFNV